MKIAFHTNQLSLRGTEIASYDYADYNEKILCNESIIISKRNNSDPRAIQKFEKRFRVFYYEDFKDVDNILLGNTVDLFYALKAGFEDGVVSKKVKTVVHAVFQHHQPHGDVYAYVSEWLGKKFNSPFVPHMIRLAETDEDLRGQLGIPKDAIVFGRYGGYETFDIPFAKNVVDIYAFQNPNTYFIFMNTEKFSDLKNIIFLEGTSDMIEKTKFINTCDAMLHARGKGESFGLAIGEFSIKNKPIFTHGYAIDGAHLEMLKGNAYIYHSNTELFDMIKNFKPNPSKDWNMYKEYTPEKVINKFKEVFID
jgi:hypothetical protein